MYGSAATPNHHHISEDDDELANGNHINSRDLDIDESIRDPIEDRRTLAERSERLHDQLRVCCRNNLKFCKFVFIHSINKMFFVFIGIETRFGTIQRRNKGDSK